MENRTEASGLDAKLRNYREAQGAALEKISPIIAEALVKSVRTHLAKCSSIEETTTFLGDVVRYIGDVSRGEVYGPYCFAKNYIPEKTRSNPCLVSPVFNIKMGKEYESFSSFIYDLNKQLGAAVDPTAQAFRVSNNTLIGFLRNARR